LVHCCRQNITIVRSNLNLIRIQNILEYIDFNRLKRSAVGELAGDHTSEYVCEP
jgi:hypothetical protein